MVPSSSKHTEVERHPERARYDRASIHAILDEGLVCHVAFVADGIPFVMPMAYGRVGDALYLHGSRRSRLLEALRAGPRVCVTVTLVDGFVLAASAFHHSVNYRSAVVVAQATEVVQPAEKLTALEAISEHAVPGRWAEVRPPSVRELAATTVLSLPLEHASAKIRCGPPVDAVADRDLPVWVGEIPLALSALAPLSGPHGVPGLPVPRYAAEYSSQRAAWMLDRQTSNEAL